MQKNTARPGKARPAIALAAAVMGPALVTAPAVAEKMPPAPSLNFYGASGLIDMPSAEQQPDAQFNFTVSHFSGITRNTLSFQISPRLSGSFRYSSIAHYLNGQSPSTLYDRSLDLRYLLVRERGMLPAVTIGLQDFAGTGVSAAEYVVATKTVRPGLKVTAGLGWGRFGSFGAIGSPLGARPAVAAGQGGTLHANTWFRGPAAPFAGIEWQVNDKLDLKLEYSSDAYTTEVSKGIIRRRSPINLGAEYRLNDNFRLGAYYLYGSEVGVSLQMALNPKVSPTGGMVGPGPLPVKPRPSRATDPKAYSTAWTVTPGAANGLRDAVAKQLAINGILVQSLSVTGDTAQLRMVNLRYRSAPQAIGRAARVLSRTMPASVSSFQIVPMVHGVPASMVTLRRSDLEGLEFASDNADKLRARTTVGEVAAPPAGALTAEGADPRFNWSLGPYLRASLFDPNDPVRADAGLRLKASYRLAPGVYLSGSVTKKVIGNLDKSTRVSNSTLPHVRSDSNLYDKHADPDIERLQFAWYAHPARNLYSRVTVGYLERMYGGISGELLWKPVGSRLALGAEVNYVKQRDYNGAFGFLNYKVATGHLSAYYQFGHGYFGQVDVGRYLAGDVGATVTFDRIFANGWRVGAFATKTNVSAAQFGEGSFDKGIRLLIPLSWALGRPTRAGTLANIHSLTRDGGARLDVDGRLYESLRDYQRTAIDSDWGRVWR